MPKASTPPKPSPPAGLQYNQQGSLTLDPRLVPMVSPRDNESRNAYYTILGGYDSETKKRIYGISANYTDTARLTNGIRTATIIPTTISSATKRSLNPTTTTVDPPQEATPVTGVKHIELDPPTPTAAATTTATTTTVSHPIPHSLTETPHQKHPTVSSEVLREAPQLRSSSLATNYPTAPMRCRHQHQTNQGMTYVPNRLSTINQVH